MVSITNPTTKQDKICLIQSYIGLATFSLLLTLLIHFKLDLFPITGIFGVILFISWNIFAPPKVKPKDLNTTLPSN